VIGYNVWIAEFSHVAADAPLVAGSGSCEAYPPTVPVAKVTTTKPNTLVFGVSMLAAPLDVSTLASPFTALQVLSGNGAAFYIAAGGGSYGPDWSVATGSGSAYICSSTAAFAEAP
jgi:hypothetical protein